jgi:hypothetical protein
MNFIVKRQAVILRIKKNNSKKVGTGIPSIQYVFLILTNLDNKDINFLNRYLKVISFF